jgi:hypothetical protein
VLFQNQSPTDQVFQFRPQSLETSPVNRLPIQARSAKIPTFLVKRESGFFRWWKSLVALCTLPKLSGSASASAAFRNTMLGRSYFRGLRLSLSLVLHCAAVALLIFVPRVMITDDPELMSVPNRIEMIYYLPERHVVTPAVKRAAVPDPPVKEKTRTRAAMPVARLTHPENSRKVTESAAAPVLHITTQTSLPQLILATPKIDAPKFEYNVNAAKPVRQQRNVSAVPVPSPTATATTGSGMVLLNASSNRQPILPLAVGPTITSHNGGPGGGGDVTADAPSIGQGVAGGAGGMVLVVVDNPNGGLPNGLKAPAGSASGSGSGASGNGPGGVSVSSSAGGGAPGGTGSVGVAYGGGEPGGEALVSSDAVLNMVYAVPAGLNVRKNALIVSAGPIGGGGLGVYNALHCGKVDTIFLPMPGKNWTMQYCPQGAAPPQDQSQAYSAVIHLAPGIVPPEPAARFDFERLPIPPSKANKLIILRGLLRDDGTVGDLQIYQSILPLMDEAARAAMGRWRFKPAMREGRPIPVQILVGIPVGDVPPRGQ